MFLTIFFLSLLSSRDSQKNYTACNCLHSNHPFFLHLFFPAAMPSRGFLAAQLGLVLPASGALDLAWPDS